MGQHADHVAGDAADWSRSFVILGSHPVIVDAVAEGIGHLGAKSDLEWLIEEVRIFLCVVLGHAFEYGEGVLGWASDMDETGRATLCEQKMLGYREAERPTTMPAQGSAPPVRRESAPHPDPGCEGTWPGMHQIRVPDDIEVLWVGSVASTQIATRSSSARPPRTGRRCI